MNADILCTLLAQRINPEHFQLWGLEVHWMKEEYDTPTNRAIVADVITNYDTLAAAYEAAQTTIRRQYAYRNEADPLFVEYMALMGVDHPDAPAKHQEWINKRTEIHERLR